MVNYIRISVVVLTILMMVTVMYVLIWKWQIIEMVDDDSSFILLGWEGMDDDGTPSVLLEFDLEGTVDLVLLDDTSTEIDFDVNLQGNVTSTYMALDEFWGTVDGGNYTLEVRYMYRDSVDTEELTFSGQDIDITNVTAEWTNYTALGYYALSGMNITVSNMGDLPSYPSGANVTVGNRSGALSFVTTTVANGTTSMALNGSIYISEIFEGTHTITVELLDFDDHLLDVYMTDVTPN